MTNNNNNVTHEDIDLALALVSEAAKRPLGVAETRSRIVAFLGEQAGSMFDAVFGLGRTPRYEHTTASDGTVESKEIS